MTIETIFTILIYSYIYWQISELELELRVDYRTIRTIIYIIEWTFGVILIRTILVRTQYYSIVHRAESHRYKTEYNNVIIIFNIYPYP